MTAILYAEINIFSIVVLMAIAFRPFGIAVNNKPKKHFFICSALFAAAANAFDFIFGIHRAGYADLQMYGAVFADFMYFMCFAISSYFAFLYSDAAGESKVLKNKKMMMLSALPLVFLAVVLICIMLSSKLFYGDNGIESCRTEMFRTQLAAVYLYVFASAVKNISMVLKRKDYIRWGELVFYAALAIPPLVCGGAQLVWQDIPILTLGVTASLLIMYINALQRFASADMLTGISNRIRLLEKLEEKAHSLRRDERLYFLFIDVDSFKKINDVYGHNEGDRVLKMVASVLKSISLKTKGFCARYGGDEFAMIQVLKRNDDVSEIRKKIHELVKEKRKSEGIAYSVGVSVGCAEYTEYVDDIQKLILYADNNMYDRKMHKKEETKV